MSSRLQWDCITCIPFPALKWRIVLLDSFSLTPPHLPWDSVISKKVFGWIGCYILVKKWFWSCFHFHASLVIWEIWISFTREYRKWKKAFFQEKSTSKSYWKIKTFDEKTCFLYVLHFIEGIKHQKYDFFLKKRTKPLVFWCPQNRTKNTKMKYV